MSDTKMPLAAKPLAGRRIVVTRAPEQSAELLAALQNLGAEVLLMPTIEFARADDSERWRLGGRSFSSDNKDSASAPTDRGSSRSGEERSPEVFARFSHAAEEFEWILFTSQNAVRFFSEILVENLGQERAGEMFSGLKAGAVGPTTADAAKQAGFRVEYVAKVHTGEGLARELAAELKGKQVLVPRSDRGDGRFPSALRNAGADVTDFVAYRTAAPKTVDETILQRIRSGEVDAVIFASPSAFDNLGVWIPADKLAELSKRMQFVAIGPTTARALRDAGVQVAVEAGDASAPALADAIVSYYKKHPTVARRA